MKRLFFILGLAVSIGLSAQITELTHNTYGSQVKDRENTNFNNLQDSIDALAAGGGGTIDAIARAQLQDSLEIQHVFSADQTDARTSAWWAADKTYMIHDSINLGANTIDFPANVRLVFEGGKLSNGELNGLHASFSNPDLVQIFDTTITFDGTWQTNMITPLDFGAVSHDTNTVFTDDIGPMLRACLASPFGVDIPAGNYYLGTTVNITKPVTITTRRVNNEPNSWNPTYGVDIIEQQGTRIYLNEDIDAFRIYTGWVYFIGGGLVDYSQAPDDITCGAFRFDLDQRMSRGRIEMDVKGSITNVAVENYGLKAVWLDTENLTAEWGQMSWWVFDMRASFVGYGLYVPHYSPSNLNTYITTNWFNISVTYAKQAYYVKEGTLFFFDAMHQCGADILSAAEEENPLMEINCTESIFDVGIWDLENDYGVIDSAANSYVGKSLTLRFEYESNDILYKGARSKTVATVENPQNFLINHSGVSSTTNYGISYVQNALAYYKDRYPTSVFVGAYDGTGFDFDNTLTNSSGGTPESSITISDTSAFFRMKGEKPRITFTDTDDLPDSYVEIVLTPQFADFSTYRPYFLSYFIRGEAYPLRIQTIFIRANDTIVSNIYPESFQPRTYVPFSYADMSGFTTGSSTLIIRFIGSSAINKAIRVQDIFARDPNNQNPPVIDIGGGQTIYGDLSLDGGGFVSEAGITNSGGAKVETPKVDYYLDAGTGITSDDIATGVYEYGYAAAVNITADPQIANGVEGQILHIVGFDATNTITLDDGAGLNLSAQWVGGEDDVITLMYINADWVEISRSDN